MEQASKCSHLADGSGFVPHVAPGRLANHGDGSASSVLTDGPCRDMRLRAERAELELKAVRAELELKAVRLELETRTLRATQEHQAVRSKAGLTVESTTSPGDSPRDGPQRCGDVGVSADGTKVGLHDLEEFLLAQLESHDIPEHEFECFYATLLSLQWRDLHLARGTTNSCSEIGTT